MTREEIDACWRDRRNHKWGIYYCKADPRAIVPERRKWMGADGHFGARHSLRAAAPFLYRPLNFSSSAMNASGPPA